MDLQSWCSARRGYPVVSVMKAPYGMSTTYFSDGRRYSESEFRWLEPLPGTDAAHEWAAHLKMEAAPKRDACPGCGSRITKEPPFCPTCDTFLRAEDLIVVVE